jgi:PAS domain S-box-containing protein
VYVKEGRVIDVAGDLMTENGSRMCTEEFATIFDAIPHPVLVRDAKAVILRANKAAEEWFGFDPTGMEREAILGILDIRSEDRQALPPEKRALERTLKGEQLRGEQMFCLFPDGAEKVVSVSTTPLIENGKVRGAVTVWEDITELEKTRQALKKENDFVSAILATSGALILVLDPRGCLVRMNSTCKEMTGCVSPDYKGRYFWQVMAPKGEWDYQKDIFRMIKEGQLKNYESRVIRLGGEERWVAWSASVLTSLDAKAVEYVIQTGIDITEMKRAEAQLQMERDFNRQIVELCPAFFTTLTLDGDVIHMNKALLDTMGYTMGEVKGKNYASLFLDDEDRRRAIDTFQDNLKKPEIQATAHRVMTKDGRELLIEWQGRQMLCEGRNDVFFSFGIDATERTRLMELFRKLFQGLPIGAFVAVGGNIVMANQHLERLSGYSEKEMAEYPVGHLIHPDDRERVRISATKMLRGEGKAPFEYRLKTKIGDIRWVMETVTAIDYSGKRGMIGTCMDITDRKVLETQLLQAQKLESIGQLAAGIAHEINTPTQFVGDNVHFLHDAFADITGALGEYREFVGAVENQRMTSELISHISDVEAKADLEYLCVEIPNAIEQSLEGIDRIAKIVGAMKEFSHPGTKERKMIDLNRALETTATVSRNEWKYVADVEFDLYPNLPLVSCMPAEFNQVLLNMVVNAAQAIGDANKHTGQKGIIKITTLNPEPGWCEIRITDNGPGIPEQIGARVFDPFFTTKEVGKGTGQGLAIARSIVVDKHGGSIRFETSPNEGTTFIIRIPAGKE